MQDNKADLKVEWMCTDVETRQHQSNQRLFNGLQLPMKLASGKKCFDDFVKKKSNFRKKSHWEMSQMSPGFLRGLVSQLRGKLVSCWWRIRSLRLHRLSNACESLHPCFDISFFYLLHLIGISLYHHVCIFFHHWILLVASRGTSVDHPSLQ